jgi:ubiquitin C-terminal hydrolase
MYVAICHWNLLTRRITSPFSLLTTLTSYVAGMFKQHINKQNPLGTGGVLAERFAELLRVMWSENYNFISPVTFRVRSSKEGLFDQIIDHLFLLFIRKP